MEYFFITSSPKSMTIELKSESGEIYKHKTDPKIKVEFQKGSVENTTPISITVLPVIRKQLENLKNDFEKPIIEDMSPILIVSQPGKPDFNKPVRCTLPYKSLASCENRKTLMVRLDHDDQAVVSEVKTKDNDNGTHSCEVKSINMCSIVQTTQSISDDKSIMNKIRDEVLYVVGEAKRCVLQTFLHKKQRLIRTEIVEIINKHKVQEKIEKDGFRWVGESSKVVTLRKGQRIRVDLTGRIRKLQKRKHFGLFVVFQPYLSTVGMEFGFEITKEMGTSHHGTIEYSSDNYEKTVLDTQHFDPSKPSSARPSLSRESSVVTAQHFVKQDGLLNIKGVSAQNGYIKKQGIQAIPRDGSNLGSYKNCPQNTNSPRGDPVNPRQARDVRDRVNHETPRPKTSIGTLLKSPITVRRQYINPQGLTRHKSDLTPYRNPQNKSIGYHLNPDTDGRKAKDVSREDQVTCRQNTRGVMSVNSSSRPQTENVVVESGVKHQQSYDGHLYQLLWNGFPRVNAFRQQLVNLYKRYKRSMATYSVQMKETPINHLELEEQISSLNAGPNILLLGEIFDRTVKALVRNEKELANKYHEKRVSFSNCMELTEVCSSFPSVVVLSERLENEDDFSKCAHMLDQDIDKLVHLFNHSDSKTILAILYAIKVSPSIQENNEQLQHFRRNFNERLKLMSLQDVTMTKLRHEDCIVFWCNDELSKTISEHLELHLVSCLRSLEVKLKENLHHRIQSSCLYNKAKFMDMIEEDLNSFISKDGGIIRKLESEFKRKVETLSADTMKDFLFDAQIQVVQMRIEKLSSSFGIQTKLIAQILSKINFQQQCRVHIQDSTVQKLMSILRSLRGPEKREHFLKLFEIEESKDYISLFVKNISFAIEDAVKQIESVEESLSIQERLHFETVSILRRTIAKEEVDYLMPDIKVPAGIQLLNGVKGFGIIYNKLHIHIQQLDEDGDKKVRNEIYVLLKDYKYPYQIGVMVNDPKLLYSHYVGQKIVALSSTNGIRRIFGSVGAFMKDRFGDMYILTALHVVGIADNASDVRLVKQRDRNDDDYTRIGSTIYRPEQIATLDIAAVKVSNDHTETCDVRFEKPDGTTGPYDIFHGSLEDINGRNVYKKGASTGLTSGLIASTNYTLMDMTPESHIWIVPENEPQGSNEFAREGDSGASVYAVEEDDEGKVNVIAMVRAGQITIMGDNGRTNNAVLAFSMHDGIRALNLELRPCEY
ncbi:hypothetical protein CHS0354_041355 [Potamilus streckersoni]|uniref:Uncharacterized protein n=1 Tax=Potamilus streckersoni TaxID=2493646 RepID=A0AAE0W9W1_9BIVA|nr:hypothetical protein CHS0354_041355 [Potamilus streckersoni]